MSAPRVGKAHQRIIRERGLMQSGLFAPPAPRSASEGRVEPITFDTAASLILDYEWLGTMPAVSLHHFGIYFAGFLGGAVVYAAEPTENTGAWDRFGFSGKIILLARGACADWTPPNSASRLIRRSMAMLPARYEVVTATADLQAGEIGTVYQACGFAYVGAMRKTGSRKYYLVGGKRISEKTARRRGIAGAAGVTRVKAENKLRYFAFRGPNAEAHRAAIDNLIQAYPKRAGSIVADAPSVQLGEGGSVPTPALPSPASHTPGPAEPPRGLRVSR